MKPPSSHPQLNPPAFDAEEYRIKATLPIKPRIVGVKVVFGVPAEIKPMRGLSDGRRGYLFRDHAVAKVFIRTSTGVSRYIVLDKGDHWEGLLQK